MLRSKVTSLVLLLIFALSVWSGTPRPAKPFIERGECGGVVNPLLRSEPLHSDAGLFKRQIGTCPPDSHQCSKGVGCCPNGFDCIGQDGCCPSGETCTGDPQCFPETFQCPGENAGCCPDGSTCGQDDDCITETITIQTRTTTRHTTESPTTTFKTIIPTTHQTSATTHEVTITTFPTFSTQASDTLTTHIVTETGLSGGTSLDDPTTVPTSTTPNFPTVSMTPNLPTITSLTTSAPLGVATGNFNGGVSGRVSTSTRGTSAFLIGVGFVINLIYL
ncbi:hypothetical protein E4T56_gene16160 [Termitomyces sp. T112]|nr:hypothetical protein E4T56_gene16160 [Termitomyces sp. T112]KAH0580547.1 hypothetical protein H2248_002040 [Termitomyces sp. 'cryptogamus']